jgi:nitrite reductase/ring-hydroxylating ferredoxin subunit
MACPPFDPDRRALLRLLAATPVLLATGCSLFEDAELRLGTRAQLVQKGYLTAEFNGNTVWVTLQGGQLQCLDLTCTHKQCTVAWKAADAAFVCPCHKGRFDAKGAVLSGKPTSPLRRLLAEERGPDIWVRNEVVAN